MAGCLRFVAGRAGAGKTALCEREIAEELKKAPIGPACVLLLPEHMTYRVERELAARLAGDGFLRAYVFGFRRFARQVLLGTGGRRQDKRNNRGHDTADEQPAHALGRCRICVGESRTSPCMYQTHEYRRLSHF